jgi:hypothetical protein
MPILGSLASGSTKSFGFGSFLELTDFYQIAITTVGSGGAANVEFTSIPETYTHLQVRVTAQNNQGVTNTGMLIQFNSDTGNNYSWHRIFGTGAFAQSSATSSTSSIRIDRIAAYSSANSIFGVCVCDILEYANTNIYKTIRNIGGSDNNGSGTIALNSGNWRSTSAITSIKFVPADGGNFNQYSSFALYGIKG